MTLREYIKGRDLDEEVFAVVSWCDGDITGLLAEKARRQVGDCGLDETEVLKNHPKFRLSTEELAGFWSLHEGHLKDRVIEEGWQILDALLTDFLDDKRPRDEGAKAGPKLGELIPVSSVKAALAQVNKNRETSIALSDQNINRFLAMDERLYRLHNFDLLVAHLTRWMEDFGFLDRE